MIKMPKARLITGNPKAPYVGGSKVDHFPASGCMSFLALFGDGRLYAIHKWMRTHKHTSRFHGADK